MMMTPLQTQHVTEAILNGIVVLVAVYFIVKAVKARKG